MKNRLSPVHRTRRGRKKLHEIQRPQLDGNLLFHVVQGGNVEEVRKILLSASDEKGQTSCGFDEVGNSSLHHAAKVGNVSVLRVLLSFGAKTNVQNLRGETPLLLAWDSWCAIPKNSLFRPPAMISVESIVELLLQYGADPNIACFELGECPLHLAARYGHPRLVQRLLKFRARPNQKSNGKDGITPKNEAMKGGSPEHLKCFQIMDRWIPDNDDFNPDKVARESMTGSSLSKKNSRRKGKSSSIKGRSKYFSHQQRKIKLESSPNSGVRGGGDGKSTRFNPRKRLGPLRRLNRPPAQQDSATESVISPTVSPRIKGQSISSSAMLLKVEKTSPTIIVKWFGFDKKLMDSLSSRWQGTNSFHPATR
jgi:hypothetical protein